jgi:2-oxoglutarate ferredoxin oxidoreductase subunit alpha
MEKKYEKARNQLVEYEEQRLDEAQVVLVAYGSTARIVKEAIDKLADKGIKAGLIRPISLWPFPYVAFDQISKETKLLISVELSTGQMIDDVKIASNGRFPVRLINRVGGILLTPEEVAIKTEDLLRGIIQ